MHVLNSLLWLDKSKLSEQEIITIKDENSVTSDGSKYGYGGEKTVEYFSENEKYIGVPRQDYFLYKKDSIDKRPPFRLWEGERRWNDEYFLSTDPKRDQYRFCRETIDGLRENGVGGIAQATPGFGKTVCSIFMTLELGLKTIIICHKEFLMNQWIDRFKAFANVECGIVRESKCDYKGKNVVVAMQQSLFSREYDPEFYEYFSFKIWDEMHHIPAETFFYVDRLFNVNYTLGVSATPRSAVPGRTAIMKRVIGPILSIGVMDLDPVKVFLVNWHKMVSRHQYEMYRNSDEISMSKLINCLCEDVERTYKIADLIVKAAKSGRKIIVLSDRLEHLDQMKDFIDEEFIDTDLKCGWYTGSIPDAERKNGKRIMKQVDRDHNAVHCSVLLATWKMAQEALDIVTLDTVVFATPHADVEQAVGRIRRPFKDKKDQFCIDICDPLVEDLVDMTKKRNRYYEREKFIVKEMHLIPNEDQTWAKVKGY